MTSKERFLTALKKGKPDMVPVAPDTSNMIPCRFTGKPYWDIYLYNDPPLHTAYLKVLKKFKFDGGWEASPDLGPSKEDKREIKKEIIEKSDDKIVTRETYKTPGGELFQEVVYWKDMPPTIKTKLIKDVQKDFRLFMKYFFPDPASRDDSEYQQWKKDLGQDGVASMGLGVSGFPTLIDYFDGSLEAMTYALYDYPELFEEYVEIYEDWAVKMTKKAIEVKPDLILTGGSGTITLQSPDIFRKLGLPCLQKITKLAKDAGIPTLVHACGKAKDLVKICAEETDLDGINPLEIPPMGDCNLKELKEKFGTRLCLMGNLHTTEVMLKGTPEKVVQEAKKAIDDAAAGGAFILSTGDQTPRDTPEENLYALIETARKYGKY
ncbi:MAG: hypothetical protein A2252_08320 [Elusimicrobia bacterium RIFOXYA2_FULL_39_19]|nr:MAG: hypothetical protein A2252_08320 [Elusimicrobia bacterium RIFOXYA2_FULL_39_19]